MLLIIYFSGANSDDIEFVALANYGPYQYDNIAPDITGVTCKTNSTGTEISSSTWQTDTTPYFEWPVPVSLAPIEGYRYLISTDGGAVPAGAYDSLIAKVIAMGYNRKEAIARMNRALDQITIDGIKTTIPLHKKVMNNEHFKKGHACTDFLPKHIFGNGH